jgi:hypothetical protein
MGEEGTEQDQGEEGTVPGDLGDRVLLVAGAAGPVHGEPAPHREGCAALRPQLLVLHASQPGAAA